MDGLKMGVEVGVDGSIAVDGSVVEEDEQQCKWQSYLPPCRADSLCYKKSPDDASKPTKRNKWSLMFILTFCIVGLIGISVACVVVLGKDSSVAPQASGNNVVSSSVTADEEDEDSESTAMPSTMEPTSEPTFEPTFQPSDDGLESTFQPSDDGLEPTFQPSDDGLCPDVCVELKQNDKSIGTVRPILTEEDIEDFYGYYADGSDYSFMGGDIVELVPDYSLLFIHQSVEDDCALSFAIVHDSREECSGGRVEMYITGDLASSDTVVQDGRDSPSDYYIYYEDDDETELFWEWSWQSGCKKRTDGAADYWNPSEYECITITPTLWDGIDSWQFVSGEGLSIGESADPADFIELDRSEALEFCYVEC